MPINSNPTVNSLSGSLRELKRDALSGTLSIAHMFGVDRLIGLRYRGKGSILMFHSVVGDIDRQLGQSIHVQDDVLRDMVRHLHTTGSDIVNLEEGMRRLSDPASRHFVALTFDDG